MAKSTQTFPPESLSDLLSKILCYFGSFLKLFKNHKQTKNKKSGKIIVKLMHSDSKVTSTAFKNWGNTSLSFLHTISSKYKKRQHSIKVLILLTFISFPVTICFYLLDLCAANEMMSTMQMWFCVWCLRDTGIVYLVITSFLQGHTQILSLCLTSLKSQRQISNSLTEDS